MKKINPAQSHKLNLLEIPRAYGLWGLIRLSVDVVCTKFTYPHARVIRRPVYIRGMGRIHLGAGFTSGPGLRIDSIGRDSKVVIGRNVQLNNNVHIGSMNSVVLGDNVLIASGVFISDHNHGVYSGAFQSSPLVPPASRILCGSPVKIGDNVWLGENVCVLPGVEIGKGVVVGAGAIVTENLPDFTLAVGSPARIIKCFDFEAQAWRPVI